VIKALYDSDEYDFWTEPVKRGITDIMASPEQASYLKKLFKDNGMKYQIKIQDVESVVEEEKRSNKRSTLDMSWDAYQRFSVIESWLLSTVQNSSIANVSVIGQTFERRNIYAVTFSVGSPKNRSVLIDANIHSREWIAGASATWIINELISNPNQYLAILNEIDLVIVPMLNADGYEYSHTNDRMWRKTRSVRSGTTCVGCDPNRNFGFMFGGESTSPNPCSDIYHGPAAFSEPETAAIQDLVRRIESNNVTIGAYLTCHSYGQYWLLPWGYTSGVYPPDYAEQLSLGQASAQALRNVHGTAYTVGQGADVLYGVGGASDDWAKNHGIKYTATIEMRDRFS